MLEEINMDKKSQNRSLQAPGKGSVVDLKKSQDATCKPSQRTFRREFTGNATPKYDPSRKPVQQKNRPFEKRPRPKGPNYGSGKENTKVAETECLEYGSLLSSGSKKQNLNHLLNFHFEPRDLAHRWRPGNANHGRQESNRWFATQKHKYNKEQFLQANCQFVVKATGDYTAYISDPDALVDWNLVEQVRLQILEEFSCPICLYPPVAAKITRCGHVFCWPCILHYLSLSDKTWRKCPICYDAVHRQDLKSVAGISHSNYSVGGLITMRLMKRERGSLVVVPVEQRAVRSREKLLSVSETSVDITYEKLLMADFSEVMSIIKQEKNELQFQLAEDKDAPEMCFIEEALELLKERENFLISKMNDYGIQSVETESLPSISDDATSGIDTLSIDSKVIVYSSAFDDEVCQFSEAAVAGSSYSTCAETDDGFEEDSIASGFEQHSKQRSSDSASSAEIENGDGSIAISAEDLEIPISLQTNSNGIPHTPKVFYFYQASDGQHIYLHSINVRMLEHQYGSLSNCPHTITGHIVEKESGSMTEDLRHRLRYLEHLPITSQFEVAEILLAPPVITKLTVDYFKDQLEARKRRRVRRDRDERRREKWIKEEENRRWGRYPAPKIRINSFHHFPQCGGEVSLPEQTLPASNSESSLASDDCILTTVSSMTTSAENLLPGDQVPEDMPMHSAVGSPESSGRSFAQMLREGKSKGPVAWSSIAKTNDLSPSEVSERPRRYSDSDLEAEGYAPAPTYKQSFSDAISLAIEKAVVTKGEEDAASQSTGKKKKKQKQKVLFTTSMACPINK